MSIFTSATPLVAGAILDTIVGDPYNIPHPIRAIGALIGGLERYFRNNCKNLRIAGLLIAVTVVGLSASVTWALLTVCERIHPFLRTAAESVVCCYMLAAKNLRDESMKVCKAAEIGDFEAARRAVSMIVGRDTAVLDNAGIIRAAVETVAENASDGVTAPLFYMGICGAVGGVVYKAVNTMDSMIGYKDEKFADIGRFAAKLDDLLNLVPSRLTALMMIAAAPLVGLDGGNALRIWRRDRRNHASPNSAQTESACAGALHLRLAGDAWYFGKLHKKPFIGDNLRKIQPQDIRRANRLMYAASAMMLVLATGLRLATGRKK